MRKVLFPLLVLALLLAACQSKEKSAPPASAPVAGAASNASDIEIVPTDPSDTSDAVSLKKYPKAKITQDKLLNLYKRIQTIKKTREFADYGFGPGNLAGHKWMAEAMALKTEADKGGVPDFMAQASALLIDLGNQYLNARRSPPQTLKDLDILEGNEATDLAGVFEALNVEIAA